MGGMAMALFFGCGSDRPEIKSVPMPEDGSFTGVFFSPLYGEMHMIQNGSTVRGEYTKDERTGKITGEADGNVMRFEWVEAKAMISNRPTETRGHGYFQYVVDPGNGDHLLKGRWGLDDDDYGGGEWNAYKAKKREPHLSGDSGSGGESTDDEYYEDDLDGDSGGGDESEGDDVDDLF